VARCSKAAAIGAASGGSLRRHDLSQALIRAKLSAPIRAEVFTVLAFPLQPSGPDRCLARWNSQTSIAKVAVHKVRHEVLHIL
jgi:hypothetical protein